MTAVRPDWAAFTPTEETRELAAIAREQFAELAPDTHLYAVAAHEDAPDLWPALVSSGYTAIGLPEANDGVGTLVDLVALLEEAGRALLPAPLTTTAAALQTLSVAELAFDIDLALALAQPRGDGTFFAFDGARAECFVVVESQGSEVRVTRRSAPSRTLEPSPLDASRTGALLSSTDIIDERILRTTPDRLLSGARICIAADLVGTAARALNGAVAHASGREQFGRVIGSFQAIKHRLADLHVDIERARSLTLGAAIAAGAQPLSDEARDLSMMAKAAASESAERAAHMHTQLLGAMGLTFEGGSQLEVRRARHTARHLGAAADLYARVAALRAASTTVEGVA